MNKNNREQILRLLEDNSRLEAKDIAIMLDMSEEAVCSEIKAMEDEHIICGYHTLINWGKVREDDVTALVELRVTPQGGSGYEKLAEYIKEFPQVEMLYLVSGSYDFLVLVNGKTAKASYDVKIGDRITINFGTRQLTVEVLDVAENVRKDDAAALWRELPQE